MLTTVNLLVVDKGLSFTMETPYNKPLGGAETSLALLSKGLLALTDMRQDKLKCVFLTNIQTTSPLFYNKYTSYNGVDSLSFYLTALSNNDIKDQLKVILVNRDFELAYRIKQDVRSISNTLVGVWTHDAYDQNLCRPLLHQEIKNSLDFILFVSDWQKRTFLKYFKLDPQTCVLAVSPNPVDVNLSYKIAKNKNSNKLVYASIPYKGLELLPDIYNLILDEVPDAQLDVFSSMRLYGNDSDADTAYAAAINRLLFIGGDRVKVHNELLPMPSLLREMAKCKVYLHPQLYHETFGMALVQAQSVGCIPVVGGGGAVKEVLGEDGALISDIATPCNPLIEDLAKKAVHVLRCSEPEFLGMMKAAENNAANYDNVTVAAKLIDTLGVIASKSKEG